MALPAGAVEAVRSRLETLDRDRFAARLFQHDATLWSSDPAHQRVAANRLGWLDSPALMRREAPALAAFAAEVVSEGLTHAVLIGMGGSSLAPEVLRLTFGVRPGASELTVLDNTSPAAVQAVLAAHDPRRTLFVVSSKSGGTIEVAAFEACCFAWVQAARGAEAGRAFVAITDPGTALQRLAGERGYRRVFSNPADIGGRYSALSYFGLVPAALIGADLDGLLARAVAELDAARETPASRHEAFRLGAALGELALAGRDKLTLGFGPGLDALGVWVEQLVAESTGKDGRGLVPVADERLGSPASYGHDRVFVAVSGPRPDPAADSRLEALRAAGHPVLRWTRTSPADLGAEFVRWEIATATAAAVLAVDPFDEPNVTEAKQATQAVLQHQLDHGALPVVHFGAALGPIRAAAPAAIAERLRTHAGEQSEPLAWVTGLLSLANPGDYVAVLVYCRRTEARHQRLEGLRHAIRSRTRLATTLGYGPRFLHSTGQLHKGGPATGIFLQLTCDEGDLPIPGQRYGFGTLQRAQAAGDYAVLERRGRRMLRLDLGADVESGLDQLIETVGSASRVP